MSAENILRFSANTWLEGCLGGIMRISFVSCVAAIVLALALCAVPCSAQSTNATVGGQITDEQGRVVPGVTVVLTNLNTGVPFETKTNGDGFYNAPSLPPGIYRANVTKDGFKSIVKGDIELHVQDQASINFQLQIGSVTETVTVEGGAPVINTQDATVKTTVDRNFAENIPMNGRSFQTLITLTPGVVLTNAQAGGDAGQFSVNGQRADANYFMVDGVGANFGVINGNSPTQSVGGTLPAFTALGGTNSLVPVDALQEFTIQTSSYGAEYGRTPGGQISIETRSGTNAFHGSAFDYFRNDALDANNWFNDQQGLPKGKERQNDFGGTFGGPIVKDYTFFFASYEGLRLLQPTTNSGVPVPSLSLRSAAPPGLQPILNSFPLPSGPDYVDSNGNPTGVAPFTESVSNPSSIDTGTIRIDHAINKRLLLFGRYSDSDSSTGFFAGNVFVITQARVKT